MISDVVLAMAKAPTDYYRMTWVPGNAVIRSLQPAKVNTTRFRELVAAQVGNVNAVATFAPDFMGYAAPVTYDRFGALTGRLTVAQGPSILTLKREYRDLLAPESDGYIVSIDFAALEVRVLLYESGRSCLDSDLYAVIAKDIGVERKAVKGAVISELYGSSKYALGKALGIEGRELNAFVKKVKSYFNTPVLLQRIKTQFYETGRVINRYGRPVVIDEPQDHIFINYYAQSTGVDVTLLGFSQIVKRLKETAPGVRPLFLLHDALILDVPRQHLEEVMGIDHVSVQGYVQVFPVKTERLTCTP
jgi:DNA polymerase I-like protein with 3'-5' exonuclease and polymerase domains